MSALGDEATVTFPATAEFSRIGRVTASGLALRLGFEVGKVEHLRLAVDAAVQALLGSGSVTVEASWTGSSLELQISNPDVVVNDADGELRATLESLVPDLAIDRTTITVSIA